MLIALFVVAHLVGFYSSIDAVMNTRTAQGAIAWAMSLNFIPIVAVPAYWIFGRSKFHGYVTLRQDTDSDLSQRWQKLRKGLEAHRFTAYKIAEAGRAAEAMAKMPMVGKNRVELLIDGEATFGSILAGIHEAKEYVLIQFYIVHDDELGRKVKDHLLAKAKQGVRVYYLYDEIGSHDLPESYERASGCRRVDA